MTDVRTPSFAAVEPSARYLEALVSLLHALDTTADVDEVARRALLTVSGQLLAPRAAFFVNDGNRCFRLRATVGVGRDRLGQEEWSVDDSLLDVLVVSGGVIETAHLRNLPGPIATSFDRIARLSNAEQTVGLLLLGGSLRRQEVAGEDQQLVRTMGVVIGTTLHRVAVQEQLIEARRRLEEAHRVRKGVMDHVSHEFNTPLMVVKSVGDLLEQANAEERSQLIEMHSESVQRLEQLVGSILRVTQEIDGDPATQSVSLYTLGHEVISPWVARRPARAALRAIFDEEHQIRAAIDPMRIEILLKELHANAVAAAGKAPPWIAVHLYATPVGWWERQDHRPRLERYQRRRERESDPSAPLWCGTTPFGAGVTAAKEVVLEMIDLGVGIPDSETELIFEPFTQAINSPNLGIKGAGMGLPTCRRLASELGGRVSVQSIVGRGSIFAVVLPAES